MEPDLDERGDEVVRRRRPGRDGADLALGHVLVFALVTIGAGRMQPDMHPQDDMSRCLRRIATFIDDHDSIDSLAQTRP